VRQIAPKRNVRSVEEGGKGVTAESRWIAIGIVELRGK
jgi:hypothetical protein